MLRPWKLEIQINFECETPLYLQIVNALINSIKSGKITAGNALPGSRKLGSLLGDNRNTVVKALDILIVEGWLVARDRKGVFVNDQLPELLYPTEKIKDTSVKNIVKPMTSIIFDDGIPDPKIAPMDELARAYRRVMHHSSRWKAMGYDATQGSAEFRETIVQMLNFKRSLDINSAKLCITRGSQMAMYLVAQVLITPGDKVIVEDPGYCKAWSAFSHAGATIVPLQVDKDGISIEILKKLVATDPNIKAVYVTPHHQYPTTVTMSLQKRLQLINLSNQYGFTIIEDDYDHEFHYGKRPILPISSYQQARHIIYVGSMSKIITPVMRMGYLVANPEFITKIIALRKIIDVQGDIIMELALLDLINSGEFRRHLKRATSHYRQKRDRFSILLKEAFGNKATFSVPDGGLAFWVKPTQPFDASLLREKLQSKGIEIMDPLKFSTTAVDGIRLGYARLTEVDFKRGISQIAVLLSD